MVRTANKIAPISSEGELKLPEPPVSNRAVTVGLEPSPLVSNRYAPGQGPSTPDPKAARALLTTDLDASLELILAFQLEVANAEVLHRKDEDGGEQ